MALSKIQFGNTGRRNLIINGAMTIAQRGTTSSALGHGGNHYHSVDRWGAVLDQDEGSGTLTTTYSQSTDVPASETFVNSLKAVVSSSSYTPSGTDCTALFYQHIETFNANPLGWGTAAAKPATLSYWIKSSVAGTGTLQLRLNDSSSVSGAQDGNYYTKFTINQADTWEKKTHLIPANTTDGWRKTVTASAIQIYWFFGSNQAAASTQDAWFRLNNYGQKHSDATFNFQVTGGTAYITGCQLEVGETASDFEHRPHGEELKLCQRYFITTDTDKLGDTTAQSSYIMGTGYNSRVRFTYYHPTTMRTKPAGTVFDASGDGNITYWRSSSRYDYTGSWSFENTMTSSSYYTSSTLSSVNGQAVMSYMGDSSSNYNHYLELNAEL